ncbi:hypothetical protein Ancab_030274 [Ancistrocladus abbreviatus]
MDFSVSTSDCHTQAVLADEFLHLDIINDLLEDEQQGGRIAAKDASVSRGVNNGPNHLNRPSALATDVGIPGEMASSASTCRFERSRSYNDDGFQEGYVCGTHIDPLSKYIPQANLMPYGNGSIDGLVQNQRQVVGLLMGIDRRKSGGPANSWVNLPDVITCGRDELVVSVTFLIENEFVKSDAGFPALSLILVDTDEAFSLMPLGICLIKVSVVSANDLLGDQLPCRTIHSNQLLFSKYGRACHWIGARYAGRIGVSRLRAVNLLSSDSVAWFARCFWVPVGVELMRTLRRLFRQMAIQRDDTNWVEKGLVKTSQTGISQTVPPCALRQLYDPRYEHPRRREMALESYLAKATSSSGVAVGKGARSPAGASCT